MKRLIITAVCSAYLGAGLFAGLMMQRAIPALNPVGVIVIALTWPNQIRCARKSSNCAPIPEWLSQHVFTFDRRKALEEQP